jgi:hypothetical protein
MIAPHDKKREPAKYNLRIAFDTEGGFQTGGLFNLMLQFVGSGLVILRKPLAFRGNLS